MPVLIHGEATDPAERRPTGSPRGPGRWVAERFVVPLKPGNSGGLSSGQTQYVVMDLEIGQPIKLRIVVRNCRWRCTRKQRREVLSESRMREICTSGFDERGWETERWPQAQAV
jgi:hypothetical protein